MGFAASLMLQGRATQAPTTLALLGRYADGEFGEIARTFAGSIDFKDLLKDLKREETQKWLMAGGPDDQARRELAAATFALEAARADGWREWKWIVNNPIGPPNVYWMPPPQLIEWGCELLRQEETPLPIERVWQLAAMGVAQRSEDTQFLIGFTQLPPLEEPRPAPPPAAPTTSPRVPLRNPGPPPFPDEVANVQKEIGHLNHVVARFPKEKRFMLGEALARERPSPADAIRLYSSLLNDPDVGAEANVRLGALLLRQGNTGKALDQFDRAEWLTRDPDLIYLARFYRGQIALKARREEEAITAFRAALLVRPGSQSASTALASLLAKGDQRVAAGAIVQAMLDAGPNQTDPHIEYMHGDDRFWPLLLEKLHREIKR